MPHPSAFLDDPIDEPQPDTGILMRARVLAQERHNGARLADLTWRERADLYAEARAIRERYLEQ